MRYPDRVLAGLLFFVGGVVYSILTLVAETAYPGYSTSTNFISDLGVGPTSAWWTAALFVGGLLGLVGTYLLYRALHPKLVSPRGLLVICLGIFGLGVIGVGVFNENTSLHGVFALMAFVFGGFSAILSFTVVHSPLRFVLPWLGILGLVSLVLFATGNDLGLGRGGMERMIVLPVLLFEIGFGAVLSVPSDVNPAANPAGGP